MPIFPLLTSGAVSQYPTSLGKGQAVQVIRFIDGSDQRFLQQGRTYRRWQIRLERLSEPELAAIENFFLSQLGDYSTFTFPDPFTGQPVPNCRFGDSQLNSLRTGDHSSSISLWVLETNG